MGDSFGGVVAGELYDPEVDFDYRALVRFAGPTTAWRGRHKGRMARSTPSSTSMGAWTSKGP